MLYGRRCCAQLGYILASNDRRATEAADFKNQQRIEVLQFFKFTLNARSSSTCMISRVATVIFVLPTNSKGSTYLSIAQLSFERNVPLRACTHNYVQSVSKADLNRVVGRCCSVTNWWQFAEPALAISFIRFYCYFLGSVFWCSHFLILFFDILYSPHPWLLDILDFLVTTVSWYSHFLPLPFPTPILEPHSSRRHIFGTRFLAPVRFLHP